MQQRARRLVTDALLQGQLASNSDRAMSGIQEEPPTRMPPAEHREEATVMEMNGAPAA